MALKEPQLPHSFQVVLDRFVAACQTDERVVAAFLGGSYASGNTDEHSDLDLGLITTDEDYDDFRAGREAFIRLLGEPLFLEDFDGPNTLFIILTDGAEMELSVGRESRFNHIHFGPYRVLVDKKGILADAVFTGREPTHDERIETLRRLIYWFWHEMSHFTKAMARGHLWWAHGQLQSLRLYCMNLARLRQDFFDAGVGDESYFKVEQALPEEQLLALQETYPPIEQGAMLQAALILFRLYKEMALPLAQAHGIAYPHDLQRVMYDRLEKLSNTPLS